MGYHWCCVGCLIRYLGFHSLQERCAGAVCAIASAVCAVLASACTVTRDHMERRHCILLKLSRLCKHCAQMSLVNHSGACGHQVRPPLEPTCAIEGNDERERRQGKKEGNRDREPMQGTKTENQGREPRQGTKTVNQD